MSGFRRIVMSSFLMLLLHFPAAKLKSSFLNVRAGDEVTFPCDNVIDDQDKCDSTTWIFSDSSSSATVELVSLGQIGKEAKAKSDRLRVTEKCALVIKEVAEEDAGLYLCRQFRSGAQEGSGSQVDLSVVTMTEHQGNDEVTLRCSVTTYGNCINPVKWLLQGRDVDTDHREIKTSSSSCSASVTFLTSLFNYTSRFELFTCAITDKYTREVQVFTFSPRSSGEDTKTTTTTTTTPTTTAAKPNLNSGWWWWIIVVIVAVAALTIIPVAAIRRKRTRGTRTETDDDMADPEDGVSYASISYTRKPSRAHLHDDDEDQAVTYSTVRAPSSSSPASSKPPSTNQEK